MRNTYTLIACLLAVSCLATPVLTEEPTVLLPSINYWEISKDILIKEEFVTSLEISPVQKSAIAKMRDRSNLDSIIQAKSLEFAQRGGRYSDHEVYLAVDDIVGAELSKILQPEQFQRLKLVKLQSKFGTGYAPFWDPEVTALCKLTKNENPALAAAAAEYRKTYQQEAKLLIDGRARKIVDSLPLQAQRKFVICVGNEYLPGITIDADEPFNNIPFPPFFKSRGTLSMVCSDERVQKLAGIDSEQLRQLQLAKEKCDFSGFERQSKYRRMPEYAEATLESSFREMCTILTKEQLLCAARIQAAGEFAYKPGAMFSRDRLTAFLMLSKEDLKTIRALIQKETEKYDASIQKLNQTTFDGICASLPEAPQSRLKQIFVGVW
jgi:hypothetical protein